MKKVYVAGSSAELDRARTWRDRLVSAGVEVVSTWIETVIAVGDANPREATTNARRVWSEDDLAQVSIADVFWLLAPEQPTRGAWVELGFAHATRLVEPDARMAIRVIISGDTRQSIFCALGEEYATDEEAFAAIVEMARAR